MHHVCFKVTDLQAALSRLVKEGMEILPDASSAGANGSRVAFLHPRSGNGVLIELLERM
jgi:methylmalonyl-CoA epimerase